MTPPTDTALTRATVAVACGHLHARRDQAHRDAATPRGLTREDGGDA